MRKDLVKMRGFLHLLRVETLGTRLAKGELPRPIRGKKSER